MKSKTFYLYAFLCLFSYFVVIGSFLSLPNENILNIALLCFSLIATSLFVIIYRPYFRAYYSSRYFKKLTSHLISIGLILIIVGFLNYLAFKNPFMHDFSQRGYSSLTKQSVQILDSVKGRLSIRIFASKKSFALFRQLTELYRLQRPQTNIEFIDASLRADMVQLYGVTKVPSILVEYEQVGEDSKKKTITDFSEQALTSAILHVSRDKDVTLYFTAGHNEVDLEAQNNEGAHHWANQLMKRGYKLKKFSLAQAVELPEDMSALIVWGPKTGFFPKEVSLIERYLERGGKVLLALDPNFQEDRLKDLRAWLKSRGLSLTNNLVIDKKKFVNGSQGTIPFVHLFNDDHPINREKQEQVFFPLTSGLEILTDHPHEKHWDVVAMSSNHPDAWGELNSRELMNLKMKYTDGIDIRGPLGYVATWESPKDKGNKIAVLGNSSFVTNTYQKFSANSVFALNIVGWLLDEDRLITFDVPELKDKPIFLGQNQLGVIFYFSVVFVPLALFLVAFFLFKRRQKL